MVARLLLSMRHHRPQSQECINEVVDEDERSGFKRYGDWLKAITLGPTQKERRIEIQKKAEKSPHPGHKAGDPVKSDAS